MTELFAVEQVPQSVRCIDCESFSFRLAPAGMAKLGFGNCAVKSMTAGHTFSATYPQRCDKFKPAPADTQQKRRDWYRSHQ